MQEKDIKEKDRKEEDKERGKMGGRAEPGGKGSRKDGGPAACPQPESPRQEAHPTTQGARLGSGPQSPKYSPRCSSEGRCQRAVPRPQNTSWATNYTQETPQGEWARSLPHSQDRPGVGAKGGSLCWEWGGTTPSSASLGPESTWVARVQSQLCVGPTRH